MIQTAFEASDFVTIGLLVALEGLLSADNAMVLAVLVLGLPKSQQRQALRYGILGAFVFRGLATLLAVYLIQLGWVKLAGAAYLLYLSIHHFVQAGGEEARRTPPKATAMFGLSAFWTTVMITSPWLIIIGRLSLEDGSNQNRFVPAIDSKYLA